MKDNKIFYIEKGSIKVKATILTNFELYGDNYCIYTIKSENSKNNNIYCAKLINNQLIKIENESEMKLVNKIVTKLIGQN